VVGESIQQRAGHPFRAEDFRPFLKRQVTGHQRRAAFVALAEDPEEQLGARLGQRYMGTTALCQVPQPLK